MSNELLEISVTKFSNRHIAFSLTWENKMMIFFKKKALALKMTQVFPKS